MAFCASFLPGFQGPNVCHRHGHRPIWLVAGLKTMWDFMGFPIDLHTQGYTRHEPSRQHASVT